MQPGDLPLRMDITEETVLRPVHRLDPNAAPGLDRMFPRLLCLLGHTRVTPEAGQTAISVLTAVTTKQQKGTSQTRQSRLPLLRR